MCTARRHVLCGVKDDMRGKETKRQNKAQKKTVGGKGGKEWKEVRHRKRRGIARFPYHHRPTMASY